MIKPLTSLRFFFAAMVFFTHIGFVKVQSPFYNWLERNIFKEGYLGVSFFFILSGFVLAYNYEQKINLKRKTLYNFYLSRFARIYPLHLVTILLALPFLIHQNILNIKALLYNIFLIQSFVPVSEIFYSINSPSWSISNEMFFYLMFPLYIYLFTRYRKLHLYFFILAPIIAISLNHVTPVHYKEFVLYVNPLTRTLDFILGISLLNLFLKNKAGNEKAVFQQHTLREITACLIFLVFFILHNTVDKSYRFSVYYWIPMSFVIYIFAFQAGVVSKFLSNRWLVKLGEVSFGFYMLHFVVLYYALWLKPVYFSQFNDIFYAILIFTFTLFLSFISYRMFEFPVNSYLKVKFTRR